MSSIQRLSWSTIPYREKELIPCPTASVRSGAAHGVQDTLSYSLQNFFHMILLGWKNKSKRQAPSLPPFNFQKTIFLLTVNSKSE